MKCDKEGYSKNHAENLRNNIYTKATRKTKLRIYYCKECFNYHLTSAVGNEKWSD